MNTLIACCWPPDSGQGISTLSKELAISYANAGYTVYYFSPKPKSFSWYKENQISPIWTKTDGINTRYINKIISQINNLDIKLIVNNDHPLLQSLLQYFSCKKIIICHAMEWSTFSLAIYNHKHADYIIAISSDMYKKLHRHGVNKEKLSLIHNGVSDITHKYKPSSHQINHPIKCIFAGNWTPTKGADLIVSMLMSSKDKIEWLQLDAFGAGKLWSKKLNQSKSWFNFHGLVSREEFTRNLAEADCLLFPSRIEGCPMTVLEALCLGVIPIVSNGKGAMREIIRNEENGFILDNKTWKNDIWKLLNRLNNDRGILIEMKKEARSSFEKYYHIDNMRENINLLAKQNIPIDTSNNKNLKLVKWHRTMHDAPIITRLLNKYYYKSGILRYKTLRGFNA